MSEQSIVAPNYRTELEKNNVIAFVPSGNSMWPTLKNHGQSVIVELKKQRLERFDVALYQRDNQTFVLHRVMEVKEGGYVICGDSQFSLEWVKEEQVFGRMLGFYRKDKYIEVTDPKYIDEIEKWFKRKKWRRLRLKAFYIRLAIKSRLKRLFSKKDGK